MFDLTNIQWITIFAAALMIGMSKGGIKGLGMVIVVIMAQAFPAKSSVGLVLPMLLLADLMAVRYYRRDAEWHYIWRLLPAAVVGVVIGVWIGDQLDDDAFQQILAWIVIIGLILLVLQESRPPSQKVIQHPVVATSAGLLGGFTTMVGNAAGPVMSVYLLATRLPKRAFIGTAAWFFLLINAFKVPFHIWSWKTLSWASFQLNLLTLPMIFIGFFVGIKIVDRIPEKAFRYFIMIVTAITAIKMLVG